MKIAFRFLLLMLIAITGVERLSYAQQQTATNALTLTSRDDKLILEALAKAAKDPSPEVRAAAARALASFDDQSVVPILVSLLEDKESFIREAAGEALIRFGGKTVVPALVEQLAKQETAVEKPDSVPVFKDPKRILAELHRQNGIEKTARLMNSLAALREKSAVGLVIRTGLKADDFSLRVTAALALGKIGGEEAARALVDALEEIYRVLPTEKGIVFPDSNRKTSQELATSSACLRTAIVWSLGQIGLPIAIPVLKKATDDPNSIVRDEARYALDKIQNAKP